MNAPKQGNGGFGKRWFCPLPKTRDFDKTAKMPSLHSTHQNKVFGPQNLETTKKTKVAGVTQAESGVFTTPTNVILITSFRYPMQG